MARGRAADQVQLALGSSGAAPGTGRQQLCTAAPFGEPKSCPDLQSTVLNQWVEKMRSIVCMRKEMVLLDKFGVFG